MLPRMHDLYHDWCWTVQMAFRAPDSCLIGMPRGPVEVIVRYASATCQASILASMICSIPVTVAVCSSIGRALSDSVLGHGVLCCVANL